MLQTFQPLLDAARGVDLTDGTAAEALLAQRLDPSGAEGARLREALLRLLEAGEIANRGEPPVRWGRVAKAGPDTDDYSIDVVLMEGPGPEHRHPRGEIDYCIALDGEPTFDGAPPAGS